MTRPSKAADRDHAPSAPSTAIAAGQERSAPTQRPPLSAVIQRAARDPRALTRADVAQLQQRIGNAAVGRLLAGAAPNRTGLPDRLKTGVESLSGFAMDDVRV